MGLLVYKINDYDYTAEREQYRTICNALKYKYSYSDEICIFVANWNIYDSELDGLIIKQDAIIAIEFKNYGGQIIATENGDWKTGEGTVIKGGVRKNPYKQAQINRSHLINGLRDSGFVSSKSLKHISSLIVFNQPISLESVLKCLKIFVSDNLNECKLHHRFCCICEEFIVNGQPSEVLQPCE